MDYLLDTSILVRLANASDVQHTVALNAVIELHRRGDRLCITSQVLIEFRSVATRPASVNGLGLSPVAAEELATTYEQRFQMLEESPAVYPAWKALVNSAGIVGKQVMTPGLWPFVMCMASDNY